jgi:hypothetical protein
MHEPKEKNNLVKKKAEFTDDREKKLGQSGDF